MKLTVLKQVLGVCRLNSDQTIPSWAQQSKQSFVSITYTEDELSIVCPLELIPDGMQCEKPWKAIKIIGPLDFGLTGILSSLTVPLAQNGISIFAISTFDTDYILIKENDLDNAKRILQLNQHSFV